MAVGRYVLVSDETGDLVIKDGPFLWDPVESPDLEWPPGRRAVTESTAAAGGYTFPPQPAAESNRRTIADRTGRALALNDAYLALTTPTNAQNLAQIRLLTRECSGVIRLLLGQLDSTEGT